MDEPTITVTFDMSWEQINALLLEKLAGDIRRLQESERDTIVAWAIQRQAELTYGQSEPEAK